jgi:hypothetical protein
MNVHPGLLAAAVGGLLLGAACASTPKTPDSSAPTASETATAGGENHSCKGTNSCKGQGNCKTDNHGCKGMNKCKGQGGCKSA